MWRPNKNIKEWQDSPDWRLDVHFMWTFSTQFLPLIGGHNHYHFQSVLINHWDTSNIIFGTYWKILQAELLLFTCLCFLLLCWASGEVQLIIAITPQWWPGEKRPSRWGPRTSSMLRWWRMKWLIVLPPTSHNHHHSPATHIHTTHLSSHQWKEGREGYL